MNADRKMTRFETAVTVGVHWLHRLVRRLTWKREVARLEWRVWTLQIKLDRANNEWTTYRECYVANMDQLHKEQMLVRDLRHRLAEVGRQVVKQRKPRLP